MKERVKAFTIFLDYIFIKVLKFVFNYVLSVSMPCLIGFFSVSLFLKTKSIDGFVLAFHVFFLLLAVWLLLLNQLKSKILNRYESI